MPDWLSDLTIAQAAGWLAAVSVVVTVLARAVRWAGPRLRRLGHLIDDLSGEPARPGHPARPGLMQRVGTLEDRLGVVEERTRELKHNGGSSIKDAVHRVDAALSDREE
ncbi:hypothetical protein [Actinoalloteichus sp. GBA129-24]|uniref:hypothetical protein n=1 Tax=Actinoalloteichus sp. GBA129-24 TaxID=1612551 RepID=UPI00095056AD|nr:hypothetical protein [Actinoalloteichus sp. GBA129-24]APU20959.1 hypothetical protein UA75_14745 [Actinoalloteichus sp. GBA129-24]APU24208.1 hypothetical protein UA75_31225 [Actinoalloteichus sp. GBA129-24]